MLKVRLSQNEFMKSSNESEWVKVFCGLLLLIKEGKKIWCKYEKYRGTPTVGAI